MKLSEYLQHEKGAELARQLGVSGVVVSMWSTGRRQTPAARCPSIERVTGGKVTCEDLRPDVEWAVLRKSGRPKKAKT